MQNDTFLYSEPLKPEGGMSVNQTNEELVRPARTETLPSPTSLPGKRKNENWLYFTFGGLSTLTVVVCCCFFALFMCCCCFGLFTVFAAAGQFLDGNRGMNMGNGGRGGGMEIVNLGCLDSQDFDDLDNFELVDHGVSEHECSELVKEPHRRMMGEEKGGEKGGKGHPEELLFAMTKSDDCYLIKRKVPDGKRPPMDEEEEDKDNLNETDEDDVDEEEQDEEKMGIFGMLENQSEEERSKCNAPCTYEYDDDNEDQRPKRHDNERRKGGNKGGNKGEKPENEKNGKKNNNDDDNTLNMTCGDESGRFYSIYTIPPSDEDRKGKKNHGGGGEKKKKKNNKKKKKKNKMKKMRKMMKKNKKN